MVKASRIAGPVLPYESGRSIKDAYNGRFYAQNAVLPPQTISPNYFFRSNNTGNNQEKCGTEDERISSRVAPQTMQCIPAKPTSGMTVDINSNPYYQSQAKASPFNSQVVMDAKLLQAQSRFGAVGAAAVAVAAHREVGAVQYGLS